MWEVFFWTFDGTGGVAGDGVSADASVSVQLLQIQPDPSATSGVNTLAANGWRCWQLVAIADATSKTVGGWDLSTATSPVGGNTSNHTGKDWGIFASNGGFAQRWAVDPDNGTLLPTPYNTGSAFETLAFRPDSFFFSSDAFAEATHGTEDNNLLNGSNPPFNQNPVPDIPGFYNMGVGTFLKAAGTIRSAEQVQRQVLAQLWAAPNVVISASGVIADGTSNANLFPFFVSSPIPEPSTLAFLGVGATVFFIRKR